MYSCVTLHVGHDRSRINLKRMYNNVPPSCLSCCPCLRLRDAVGILALCRCSTQNITLTPWQKLHDGPHPLSLLQMLLVVALRGSCFVNLHFALAPLSSCFLYNISPIA